MQSKFVSRSTAALVGCPQRFFRKSYNATYYNQRFTPSQGKDNQYFYTAQHVHGANGAPAVSILPNLVSKRCFDYRPRPSVTQPSSSTQTTSSRTTTGSGDREPVTTSTRSARDSRDPMTDGHAPASATPLSPSTCSAMPQSGKFFSPSPLSSLLLESEIRAPSQPWTRSTFLILCSPTRRSAVYSPQPLTT